MVQNIDSTTYTLIKKALDASSERGKVIAQNIANVNTPGYKAYSVNFEDKLNNILNGNSLEMKVTDPKHMTDGDSLSTLTYDVEKDNSTSMRSDGNNVDIDGQMTDLAANTIMYNALIEEANNRFSMRSYVITGGGQ